MSLLVVREHWRATQLSKSKKFFYSIIINIAIIISQDDEISCSYYQLGILFMILPVAIAILFFTALLVGANIFRKIRTLRKKL